MPEERSIAPSLHRGLNPEHCFKKPEQSSVQNNNASDSSDDWLTILVKHLRPHQTEYTTDAGFLAAIKTYTHGTYDFADRLSDALQFVYRRITSDDTITDSDKAAYAIKIAEGLGACTAGVHARINALIISLKAEMNSAPALLHEKRRALVTEAFGDLVQTNSDLKRLRGAFEVHIQEYVFFIADEMKLGVSPSVTEDEDPFSQGDLITRHKDSIQKTIERVFSRRYNLFTAFKAIEEHCLTQAQLLGYGSNFTETNVGDGSPFEHLSFELSEEIAYCIEATLSGEKPNRETLSEAIQSGEHSLFEYKSHTVMEDTFFFPIHLNIPYLRVRIFRALEEQELVSSEDAHPSALRLLLDAYLAPEAFFEDTLPKRTLHLEAFLITPVDYSHSFQSNVSVFHVLLQEAHIRQSKGFSELLKHPYVRDLFTFQEIPSSSQKDQQALQSWCLLLEHGSEDMLKTLPDTLYSRVRFDTPAPLLQSASSFAIPLLKAAARNSSVPEDRFYVLKALEECFRNTFEVYQGLGLSAEYDPLLNALTPDTAFLYLQEVTKLSFEQALTRVCNPISNKAPIASLKEPKHLQALQAFVLEPLSNPPDTDQKLKLIQTYPELLEPLLSESNDECLEYFLKHKNAEKFFTASIYNSHLFLSNVSVFHVLLKKAHIRQSKGFSKLLKRPYVRDLFTFQEIPPSSQKDQQALQNWCLLLEHGSADMLKTLPDTLCSRVRFDTPAPLLQNTSSFAIPLLKAAARNSSVPEDRFYVLKALEERFRNTFEVYQGLGLSAEYDPLLNALTPDTAFLYLQEVKKLSFGQALTRVYNPISNKAPVASLKEPKHFKALQAFVLEPLSDTPNTSQKPKLIQKHPGIWKLLLSESDDAYLDRFLKHKNVEAFLFFGDSPNATLPLWEHAIECLSHEKFRHLVKDSLGCFTNCSKASDIVRFFQAILKIEDASDAKRTLNVIEHQYEEYFGEAWTKNSALVNAMPSEDLYTLCRIRGDSATEFVNIYSSNKLDWFTDPLLKQTEILKEILACILEKPTLSIHRLILNLSDSFLLIQLLTNEETQTQCLENASLKAMFDSKKNHSDFQKALFTILSKADTDERFQYAEDPSWVKFFHVHQVPIGFTGDELSCRVRTLCDRQTLSPEESQFLFSHPSVYTSLIESHLETKRLWGRHNTDYADSIRFFERPEIQAHFTLSESDDLNMILERWAPMLKAISESELTTCFNQFGPELFQNTALSPDLRERFLQCISETKGVLTDSDADQAMKEKWDLFENAIKNHVQRKLPLWLLSKTLMPRQLFETMRQACYSFEDILDTFRKYNRPFNSTWLSSRQKQALLQALLSHVPSEGDTCLPPKKEVQLLTLVHSLPEFIKHIDLKKESGKRTSKLLLEYVKKNQHRTSFIEKILYQNAIEHQKISLLSFILSACIFFIKGIVLSYAFLVFFICAQLTQSHEAERAYDQIHSLLEKTVDKGLFDEKSHQHKMLPNLKTENFTLLWEALPTWAHMKLLSHKQQFRIHVMPFSCKDHEKETADLLIQKALDPDAVEIRTYIIKQLVGENTDWGYLRRYSDPTAVIQLFSQHLRDYQESRVKCLYNHTEQERFWHNFDDAANDSKFEFLIQYVTALLQQSKKTVWASREIESQRVGHNSRTMLSCRMPERLLNLLPVLAELKPIALLSTQDHICKENFFLNWVRFPLTEIVHMQHAMINKQHASMKKVFDLGLACTHQDPAKEERVFLFKPKGYSGAYTSVLDSYIKGQKACIKGNKAFPVCKPEDFLSFWKEISEQTRVKILLNPGHQHNQGPLPSIFAIEDKNFQKQLLETLSLENQQHVQATWFARHGRLLEWHNNMSTGDIQRTLETLSLSYDTLESGLKHINKRTPPSAKIDIYWEDHSVRMAAIAALKEKTPSTSCFSFFSWSQAPKQKPMTKKGARIKPSRS